MSFFFHLNINVSQFVIVMLNAKFLAIREIEYEWYECDAAPVSPSKI
jgi:hypothetical protein